MPAKAKGKPVPKEDNPYCPERVTLYFAISFYKAGFIYNESTQTWHECGQKCTGGNTPLTAISIEPLQELAAHTLSSVDAQTFLQNRSMLSMALAFSDMPKYEPPTAPPPVTKRPRRKKE
jgi:hypothetical protein